MNRRNESDIFSLKESKSKPETDQQFDPNWGSASGRRNKLRGASSSVFPVGCMGTAELPKEEEDAPELKESIEKLLARNEPESPKIHLEAGDIDPLSDLPDLPTPGRARSVRNPLTGEGIESSDMPKYPIQRKKCEQTKFLY